MKNYTFDLFGWFEKEVGLATLRSVEVAPPFIPDYPREVGKAWPMLSPDMQSWKVYAYEAPHEEIKASNVVSKAEFSDLFGFPKLTELEVLKETDPEVRAAFNYAMVHDQIVVDHPKTLALLALLGTKGLLTKEQIESISSNKPIW